MTQDIKRMEQSKQVKPNETNNKYTVSEEVNSKAFHDKFEKLKENKQTRESLYKASMEILNDRNGTNLETAVALDRKTGKKLAKTNTNAKYKSGFSKLQISRMILESDEIVLIHNHPGGGRLSFGDIKYLYSNSSFKAMYAVGHNGDLYGLVKEDYLSLDELEKLYALLYNEFVRQGLDKVTSSHYALDVVYKKYFKEGNFKYGK